MMSQAAAPREPARRYVSRMDALTEEQRASLRRALEALEKALDNAHEVAADGAAPVDLEEPIGRVSRMDAIAQRHMVLANRTSLQLRLQRVRAALRRFDAGEYGVCVTCGETREGHRDRHPFLSKASGAVDGQAAYLRTKFGGLA